MAAIAIPRFGGFTEKAKVGNDEQYAALVANATNIIVASGDVAYTAGATITIDISPNGSVADITGVTFGGTGHLANIAAFRTEIEKLVAKEALQSTTYANGMTISATDSGVGTIATKTVVNPS